MLGACALRKAVVELDGCSSTAARQSGDHGDLVEQAERGSRSAEAKPEPGRVRKMEEVDEARSVDPCTKGAGGLITPSPAGIRRS